MVYVADLIEIKMFLGQKKGMNDRQTHPSDREYRLSDRQFGPTDRHSCLSDREHDMNDRQPTQAIEGPA